MKRIAKISLLVALVGSLLACAGTGEGQLDDRVANGDEAWLGAAVKDVRSASRWGNLAALEEALSGRAALAITELKRSYVAEYGNAVECAIRGYDIGIIGFRGSDLDAALDLLHGAQAHVDAGRIFARLSAAGDIGDAEMRAEIYRIMSVLGGLERDRLRAIYAEMTGSDLDADLARVALVNPHYTRVDERTGVSTIVTGTGRKAADDTARSLVQILQR
ncbi:MAG: hypothetical protein MJE77_11605 [Proteobacteria bacterium]|nr:hypothetical protein [Pseudomonadota bacterium]